MVRVVYPGRFGRHVCKPELVGKSAVLTLRGRILTVELPYLGSWDFVTKVINKVTVLMITYNTIYVSISVLPTSHDPPSTLAMSVPPDRSLQFLDCESGLHSTLPKGPCTQTVYILALKYPNSIYFGLKVVPIWVHWGQCIYYLGTWTLRVFKSKALTLILSLPNPKPLNRNTA